MSLKDTVNRIMGRSVRDLAEEVDAALGRLAEARGLEAECEVALAAAQADVRHAMEGVARARDALFREHPELRPEPLGEVQMKEAHVPQPDPSNPALLPGQDPSKFEVIDVDDSDDPRFTAGYSPVPTGDNEPLPEITWTEHEE